MAGFVPAIYARNRLLTFLERLGAAAGWALGTSPRVPIAVVAYAGAMAAEQEPPALPHPHLALDQSRHPQVHSREQDANALAKRRARLQRPPRPEALIHCEIVRRHQCKLAGYEHSV